MTALITEQDKAVMVRMAPLVDEVITLLSEVRHAFTVEEVFIELRAIFDEHKQRFYHDLGYQAWSMCIRGRLNALQFELVNTPPGSVLRADGVMMVWRQGGLDA